VEYTPKIPGDYQVHVTLNGEHIPGSIFHVTVLEDLSLGGEGKIRIFYSTTSASNEKSRPLQELLEKKKVHLRPDFEPWIPVDIMEPKDREAVVTYLFLLLPSLPLFAFLADPPLLFILFAN
jgi:hypothetical protein